MRIEFGRKAVLNWVLKIRSSRLPDFIVGAPEAPYLLRWYLTPKFLRPIFAIYLHEFYRDDDDVPHDHPYLFNLSWVLQIGYFEDQFSSDAELRDYRVDLESKWRAEGAVVARWGWTAHRIRLKVFRVVQATLGSNVISNEGNEVVERIPKPITIFICGPRVRTWGFHCPKGWKPYFDYIAPTSYGNRLGKGCGD